MIFFIKNPNLKIKQCFFLGGEGGGRRGGGVDEWTVEQAQTNSPL